MTRPQIVFQLSVEGWACIESLLCCARSELQTLERFLDTGSWPTDFKMVSAKVILSFVVDLGT